MSVCVSRCTTYVRWAMGTHLPQFQDCSVRGELRPYLSGAHVLLAVTRMYLVP